MSNETDNDLSLLTAIIQEELELARSGDGYEEKGVAEEIVRDHVAPLLAAKDEKWWSAARFIDELRNERIALWEQRDEALRKLALAEAANPPAGDALVDLVEARRLLRERNRAYGRASATIGVLRGALARTQAARTWLTRDLTATSAERAAWANKAELLRAELDAVKADAVVIPDDAPEVIENAIINYSSPPPARVLALDLMRVLESWRGQPDTEATEQAPVLVDAIIQRAVVRCADMDGVSVDTCGVDRLDRYRDYVTATLAELPMDVLGQLSPQTEATEQAPREPRVWREGDPEPDDVYEVSDQSGGRWSRRHDGFWVELVGRRFIRWDQLLQIKARGLTEVIEDGTQ